MNATSGFECIDDVIIGDAADMPSADHCAAAPLIYTVPGITVPRAFSTVHAGNDLLNWFAPGNPNFPANRDIWFTFVASHTGTAVIDTVDNTTTFDTVLAVYDNSSFRCPFQGQNPAAFNDDAVGVRSRIVM